MGEDGGNAVCRRTPIGPDWLVLTEAWTPLHAPDEAKAAPHSACQTQGQCLHINDALFNMLPMDCTSCLQRPRKGWFSLNVAQIGISCITEWRNLTDCAARMHVTGTHYRPSLSSCHPQ